MNLCVGSPWNATAKEHAAETNRTFWTSTDVLQDAQVVLATGSTQRSAEQELNKKWWTKVMQSSSTRLEIRKTLCQNLMLV